MKKAVLKLLPETGHTQIVYIGRKLCTCFQTKGKSKFDHLHDLIYHQSVLVRYAMKII